MAEVVVPKIRARAYVVGLVMVVIMTVLTSFIGIFTNSGMIWTWPVTDIWLVMYLYYPLFLLFWPFVASVIAALISWSNPNALNKSELTIAVSMLWVTWMIPTWFGITAEIVFPAGGYSLQDERWFAAVKPINWVWGPDFENAALWRGILEGGSSVPWGSWAGFLVFQTVYLFIGYYALMALVATLFRRQWVEIEGLPFPSAVAAVSIINSAYDTGSQKSETRKLPMIFRNKWLYAGMIVTMAETAPFWLPAFSTAFPVTIINVFGVDLTPLGVVPYRIPMVFNFELFYIGMAMFIPTRFLLSWVITWFFTDWILPVVFGSAGIWDTYTGGDSWTTWVWVRGGWGDWGPVSRQWAENLMGFYGLPSFGAMLAVILIPLIRMRKEFGHIISSLWKKPPAEVEKNEPIPLRVTWILVIALLVAFTGMSAYLGGSGLQRALPMLFLSYILWAFILHVGLMQARAVATYGGNINPNNDGGFMVVNSIFGMWYLQEPSSPWYIPHSTPEKTQALFVTGIEPYGFGANAQHGPSVGSTSILESYKMAQLTGVHPRQILKAFMIAVPVAIFLTLVLYLQMAYTWGLQAKASGFQLAGAPGLYVYSFPLSWAYEDRSRWYTCATWWRGPVPTLWIGYAWGFIGAAVLYFLTMKFAWWPVHPVGFAVALNFSDPHFFTPILIALVVKYLIIRIGGTKLFEEKGMPFAVGAVIATGILMFLTGLANAQRALAGI